ncbi:LpxL/LpxP family Kdo(2)-lipid IV(A) lauroyl/palmitoleoyl acyltransferase [Marinimicrobium agarilyticum]|uniref:LpxL/LpxP family Kdo(2)-lipid IV(A) lauroyl/palmitoleoyl acyltransferase n=1 Tax=Marinimicrobium agarilyticum TaxID=306546 RepID=UPI0004239D7A|nr:LpxL/LpxP family Kdo(2)-lipid IV(A) lauroyl/palmitoleoyl acyltransferase [Marinimicrobium agarilyticum]
MPRVSRQLFHPRYWLTWVGFGIWWLLALLPYRIQMALGRGLGRLLWHLAKSRRRTALRNLELCFPEKPEQERWRLARRNFESTAQAFFETGMSWFWPRWRMRRLCSVEGLEHLQAAQQSGQGVVLLGMHFTNLDLGAKLLCLNHSVGGLYRPHNNPVYDYMQLKGREHLGEKGGVIARDDIRQMVRRLRQNKVVWYAPDQDYGARRPHVFVPFFGIPAATITATSQLVRMGRAQLIPFTHHRREDGSGYDVKVYPPLTSIPTGDDEADAAMINAFVEARVRECPEQYMWVHRRFKTRPEGEKPLY